MLRSWPAHGEEEVKTSSLVNFPNDIQPRFPGPAFLPSEHDELPPGVAFMVCYAALPLLCTH